jgi:hypothetical protein
MIINKIYYYLKPAIPRTVQIALRRAIISRKRNAYKNVWPIDPEAGEIPSGWQGWPEQKKFALVLTHDVDTVKGQNNCHELIKVEENLGFRSSFNFVPERYPVSSDLRRYLVENGFEVGVHGLNHDGKLYFSEETFKSRAFHINRYLREWESVGFRSPSMQHNLEWIGYLNIEYDASTFDTDPFEPHPDGMRTIFPFWVNGSEDRRGYVELPYTLPQDFTLFILMKENNIDIWKNKIDWIASRGGMALINVHPDYIQFNDRDIGLEEYSINHYVNFLKYILKKYNNLYWNPLPKEISRFWIENTTKT